VWISETIGCFGFGFVCMYETMGWYGFLSGFPPFDAFIIVVSMGKNFFNI